MSKARCESGFGHGSLSTTVHESFAVNGGLKHDRKLAGAASNFGPAAIHSGVRAMRQVTVSLVCGPVQAWLICKYTRSDPG